MLNNHIAYQKIISYLLIDYPVLADYSSMMREEAIKDYSMLIGSFIDYLLLFKRLFKKYQEEKKEEKKEEEKKEEEEKWDIYTTARRAD